ncbi:MAG: peptide-methionine (R)-S-oxide reductase MsrB [Planctomycetota bacterium]
MRSRYSKRAITYIVLGLGIGVWALLIQFGVLPPPASPIALASTTERPLVSQAELAEVLAVIEDGFPHPHDKVEISKNEWKDRLDPQEFYVLREHGTDRAFSGDLSKNDGVYVCAGCHNVLFDSETKFDSGTGWPSFHSPVADHHVGTTRDTKFGMVRTEVHCARCGGHQGHVFPDGPHPTGLRYCINFVSIKFIPREHLPEAAAAQLAKSD